MRAKFIFENFDSQEDKEKYSKFFSKEDLAQMTDLQDYKNKFQHGAYHGEDSSNLNTKIENAVSFVKDFDANGAKEIMYRILIEKIPEFKKFKVSKDHFNSPVHYLNLQKEIPIKKKLDDDYSVEVNLYITYIAKEDDLMGYKENTFKFIFSPNITTTRKSIGFNELVDDEDILKNINDDKKLDKFMKTLSKSLYGMPDEEDKQYKEKLEMSINNISLEDLTDILPLVKENLLIFNKYIKSKYDISLF